MPNKPRLFALLAAIDTYAPPVRPLKGCVNDIKNFENYLKTTQSGDFDLQIKTCLNGDCTKANLVGLIRSHLGQAQTGDVALLYYSGHGAEESADPKVWWMEPNQRLQGLVCFDSIPQGSRNFNLLADKELRFLLHELEKGSKSKPKNGSPKILTIFDCCHSGSNTRSAEEDRDEEVRPRMYIHESRLSNSLPVRDWNSFVFAQEVNKQALSERKITLKEALPEANYISLSACSSDESAYETMGSGVFSKNLLDLLNRTEGAITYADLRQRLNYFIKNQFKQTPLVLQSGANKGDLYNSFLFKNLHEKPVHANVVFNDSEGWVIDLGSIHGISSQAGEVILEAVGLQQTYEAIVNVVKSDRSTLAVDPATHQALKGKIIKGYLKNYRSAPIAVYVQNHAGNTDAEKQLLTHLKQKVSNLNLSKTAVGADYAVQIQAKQYVITRGEDPLRPLVLPAPDLGDDSANQTAHYLKHISQWEYVRNLENKGPANTQLGQEVVEFSVWQESGSEPTGEKLLQIQDEILSPVFVAGDFGDRPYGGNLKISIRNKANYPVYVSLLYISEGFEVYGELISEKVIKLDALGPNNPQGPAVFAFDGDWVGLDYSKSVEVFNHPSATFQLKLIVSRQEFNIDKLLMDRLPDPSELVNKSKGDSTRGPSRTPANQPGADAWMTRTITVKIANPRFNKVPESLLKNWLQTEAGPFVEALYFQPNQPFGGNLSNRGLEADEKGTRGGTQELVMDTATWFSRQWRHMVYREMVKRYPDRPRMVSEGDSWFQYPDPRLLDIIDYLLDEYPVYSLDAAGDQLQSYAKEAEYLRALKEIQPQFLILSGGGNDIMGSQFKDFLHANVSSKGDGKNPERFLNEAFSKKIKSLGDTYREIFKRIGKQSPKLHILIHGYDYLESGKKNNEPWLGGPMKAKGIQHLSDRQAVLNHIINTFNELLSQLDQEFKQVHYINLRGTMKGQSWHDEIHPTSAGFRVLAAKFKAKIEELRKS
jgi:lysophospholipase L1-like esterase